ncbi:hypothetical protein DNX69_17715 [Rhodopseudomonas palustris]|uniref:Uncharacterized protein n=1 Tax=Rhodopseudomonas palustris TaxID=1076 RepID=A0A323UF98_RHOPL|nr:hypothetical protein [Rhodopseudomonas palustris]PZA11602.1 hypothetical protein DNX69_17715 [Rhodopseudomonas palustris]
MSEASVLNAAHPAAPPLRWSVPRPVLAIAAALIAAAAAVLTAPDAATAALAQRDTELVLLLRFMAGVKAVLAFAALGAVVWRLGYPAAPLLSAAYVLAPALMVAAPLLIWQIAPTALGAGLFHGGLALLLLALFADRGQASELVRRTLLVRHSA